MPTATITSKGQLTIPVEVRRRLGLKAGSRLEFVLTDSGTYEMVPATASITAVKGAIRRRTKPVTLAEMTAAIEGGARRGHDA